MYRPRLRSNTGCLRCKKRKTKCDETLPRCSYCTRWDLSCVRASLANQSHRKTSHRDQHVSQPRRNVSDKTSDRIVLLRRPGTMTPSLDSFHKLPISSGGDRSDVTYCLRYYFTNVFLHAYHLNINGPDLQLGRGWLESLFTDEAACCALIGFCAAIQAHQTSQKRMKRLSLEFEERTLSLLRERVHRASSVTEGTILAAIAHFGTTTLDTTDEKKMSTIFKGISALVQARGGFERGVCQSRPILRQSLLDADNLNALWNASRPVFGSSALPQRPCALDWTDQPSCNYELTDKRMGPAVSKVFQQMRFLSFFRAPSRPRQILSSDELWYLIELSNWIESQLGVLQAQHIGSGSVTEIVVLGLILMKSGVFPGKVWQLKLAISIMSRLQTAISACIMTPTKLYESAALWASLNTLVGHDLVEQKRWFTDFFVSTLRERLEKSHWPREWRLEVRAELQQFPWHERIEIKYVEVCNEIEHQKAGSVVSHEL